jgi:endonuclease/exonuclease/phosphatase family metal-dependent hydrolase
MKAMFHRALLLIATSLWAFAEASGAASTFTVATYNVENYLDAPGGGRPAKSAAAKAKLRESIRALNADVLAMQEMGGTNALLELRASLKAEGLDYPHWEHIRGFDTNIHLAVLSRFPFVTRRPHTNDTYLLSGRRLHVSRGFIELEIKAAPAYTFTVFVAHLKSKRPVPIADQAEMREEEAKLLREKVTARLKAQPNANVIVVGDMNDTHDSKSTRVLIGRGNSKLVDVRPAERNGDTLPNPNPKYLPRHVTWTHHYGVEDTYSRIDYILLSAGMARDLDRTGTFIFTAPDWGIGSDHRPIMARFFAEDR